MSGRRCRALAAAFEARNGRVPNRTLWKDGRYYPSEWRRVKKGVRHEASPITARRVAEATAAVVRKAKQRRRRRRRGLVAA